MSSKQAGFISSTSSFGGFKFTFDTFLGLKLPAVSISISRKTQESSFGSSKPPREPLDFQVLLEIPKTSRTTGRGQGTVGWSGRASAEKFMYNTGIRC